jgi:hypothetical protein
LNDFHVRAAIFGSRSAGCRFCLRKISQAGKFTSRNG